MCVRALFETCEIGFRAIRDRKVLSWECVLGGLSEGSPMLRRVRILPAALAPLQVHVLSVRVLFHKHTGPCSTV